MAQKTYLLDMDGVLVRGRRLIPGAAEFIDTLTATGHKFMLLTNNSRHTRTDVQRRLKQQGLNIDINHIYTSAMAAAAYLTEQQPGGTVFALGDLGLYQALSDAGYALSNHEPDFVLLGECDHHTYDNIIQAANFILTGARFVATNPDVSNMTEFGLVPGCGSVAALIEKTTGVAPYVVGKPNLYMLQAALTRLGEKPENVLMVGDNLDTDIEMGRQGGVETLLVLSGVTSLETLIAAERQPHSVAESVAHISRESLVKPLPESLKD
ncbi:MAG: Dihydroxyacetone phosphatase [Anaerolineae bacterium]|nr:Dihydroxyacetone phosphatase [Anaerolineae bacterium]